jgi:hypothetical protein
MSGKRPPLLLPTSSSPSSPLPPQAGALARNVTIFVILVAAMAAVKLPKLLERGPAEVTPLRASLLKELPQFQGSYADDMLWGTYRSGLYFGMRTRCTSAPLRPCAAPGAA